MTTASSPNLTLGCAVYGTVAVFAAIPVSAVSYGAATAFMWAGLVLGGITALSFVGALLRAFYTDVRAHADEFAGAAIITLVSALFVAGVRGVSPAWTLGAFAMAVVLFREALRRADEDYKVR